MATTVTITHNRFPEIAEKLPREASAVVRKTAFDIETWAKSVVPVDTGALKNSINTDIEDGGLSAEVKTNMEYCEFVELGTYKMAAQPYMIPAAERNAPHFQAAVKALLRQL